MPARPVRLPEQWSKHVKSGILHAISLASCAGGGPDEATLRAAGRAAVVPPV